MSSVVRGDYRATLDNELIIGSAERSDFTNRETAGKSGERKAMPKPGWAGDKSDRRERLKTSWAEGCGSGKPAECYHAGRP